MTTLVVVLTAVVAVQSVLVAGLLRSYAEVLRRLHALDGGASGPPLRTAPGTVAPVVPLEARDEWTAAHDVQGRTLAGEVVAVRVVGVGHDTVLAFLSSGCAGCQGFWADLRRGVDPALGARLVVVTKDPAEESASELGRLAPDGVDVVCSSAAWEDYAVPGSPFVVVVDGATGRVRGHGSGTSFDQVAGLLAQATGDLAAARTGRPRADLERERDVDRALVEAGILPGHPSLHGGQDR